jgi:hypothetical protein
MNRFVFSIVDRSLFDSSAACQFVSSLPLFETRLFRRDVKQGLGDCTAEALRAQSWKIDCAKTPRTQRKYLLICPKLGGLRAFARDILNFSYGPGRARLCGKNVSQ